jgi:hypothetical protein
VVITTSIVASAGASMPAPLAIPPTVQPAPSCTACLATVSVVMIACAAALPPSSASSAPAAFTPASSRGVSSSGPINPVEQTRTSRAEIPVCRATSSAVLWVVAKPSGPV